MKQRRWRDKFLEGGKRSLINGASDDNIYKTEIEKLEKASKRYR